jgi:hypothetical protein
MEMIFCEEVFQIENASTTRSRGEKKTSGIRDLTISINRYETNILYT